MTSLFDQQGIETQLLHGGQEPDPSTGSRAVPIYQTTSYVFKDTEHAQNLFALAEQGNIYSRIMNPTVDAFEQRIALLEDGVAAVATSSGMSAISLAILNIAGSGDEIIADSNLYGGTYNLFHKTLPKYGITVKFVDGTNPENFRVAITDKTKAIFSEIISNPSLNILDVEEVSQIAHQNGIPLIVDNTFATPYLSKPITWGADIVVHSATKWIGGHGTTIGGVVVDGGRFQWNEERFPEFNEPDESYHGLRYAQDIGPAAFAIKLRVQLLRDIGACLSPQNAFLLLQGLETLHLRVEKHNENTKKVANYLAEHPAVEWVTYPGLEDHPSHEKAKKYLNGQFGSILTFGIRGGRKAGRRLIDHINLWSHVANVGDAKSLIIHPASTTHQQLSEEGLKQSGVTEELVRLSVGLETPEDIIQDLDQAISKATGTKATVKETTEVAIRWALTSPFDRSNGQLRQKSIAILGLTNNPTSSIYQVATKLQSFGFNIIPVQPNETKILGKESYQNVSSVTIPIDILYVTNTGLSQLSLQELDGIHAKILWLDSQDVNLETTDTAKLNDITVVENRCPYEEAVRLRGYSNSEPIGV
ncbi:PLP-dependent aspartate aminotransferase family protein [Terrihalobacillus insolitus]|uniref:PLP-dependent aspartate aminotransferase family protein n=1 Tax=Terrihalobacillus insolitus TaxID=2950438 RepID=UPI0023426F60|nr:aminotransferase class V-fold PLP-dependent enzyme [Terrihalobacillus insolitus]MDC3414570.1 aminotransferase class I/II-fold pyridoxal phosphate-dependent enzyme [Terrihalobacillus insolitus]